MTPVLVMLQRKSTKCKSQKCDQKIGMIVLSVVLVFLSNNLFFSYLNFPSTSIVPELMGSLSKVSSMVD